jgi:hypothetical protein
MLWAIGGSNILYVHICSNLLDLFRICSAYCRLVLYICMCYDCPSPFKMIPNIYSGDITDTDGILQWMTEQVRLMSS